MAKYLEYWKAILKKIRKELDPAKPWPVSYLVNELEQLGERDASGYNGYLRLWAGQANGRTASQVFVDLEQAVREDKAFRALCAGKTEFRITLNNTLTITHQPLTPDDFIERYKGIQATEAGKAEVYKWKLVKANHDLWAQYERRELTFQQYFLKLDFANLVYPLAWGVMKEVAKGEPAAFEQLLLALYGETQELPERLAVFRMAFAELYSKLPDPGENAFMEGRTMAALLTWRYPERYTIFKDSFYMPYCKALGIKPAKPGDKVPHFLEMVRALASEHIPRHPVVIAARDAMLDDTCYKDLNNMVLAQDILYMTTRPDDEAEGGMEVSDEAEQNFLKALHSFSPEEQRVFLMDLEKIVAHLDVTQDDGRVVFHAVPTVPRLGFTIGPAYCFQLGSDKELKHGFALDRKGEFADVQYLNEFKGANARVYGYTDVHDRVEDHWEDLLTLCKQELARTERSLHRNKNNPYFEKAVFDLDYRTKVLGGYNENGIDEHDMSTSHPLNTILYGPPGTGKTYHAITHAVAIIDGEDVEVVKKRDRKVVRKRYQQLFDARLVRTVTFHQSFSYEDFIEGIKPQTHVSKNGEEEVKQVTYELQDGIFKLMCASARTGEQGAAGKIIDDDSLVKANFYKVSLGQYNDPADDEIYAHCIANNVIAVGYGGSVDVRQAKDEAGIKGILKGAGFKEDGEGFRYTVSVLRTMHLDMKVGDIVLVSAGNSMVRAIGRVAGGYFMDENAPIRFKQFLKVDWLANDVEIPVDDLYPKNLTMGTLYSLDRNLVKKDYFRRSTGASERKQGRYVLIIDEINRGNVASIFGELITLIEDDKREGGDEPARVKLPYSKDDFSVPSNLYLLGTMNTADRSVEALDTALRRRFSFVEMPSQPKLIEPTVVEGVDLLALLNSINERVEQLLDKDHHVGHSYFMGLENGADLKRVFATKVLPLLEEYFHGDAKKVGAVLGEAFVEVRKKTVAFAKGFDMDEYEVKELYTVKDPRTFTDLAPFKAINAGA